LQAGLAIADNYRFHTHNLQNFQKKNVLKHVECMIFETNPNLGSTKHFSPLFKKDSTTRDRIRLEKLCILHISEHLFFEKFSLNF